MEIFISQKLRLGIFLALTCREKSGSLEYVQFQGGTGHVFGFLNDLDTSVSAVLAI